MVCGSWLLSSSSLGIFRLLHLIPVGEHSVDQAVPHCLFRAHEIITVHIFGHFLHCLACMFCEDVVEPFPDAKDFLSGDLDVRCNLLVYQSRLERTEVSYVGRREDRLCEAGSSLRIRRRKIILDQTLVPRTLSIFL